MPSTFLTFATVLGSIYAVHGQNLSSTIVGCIDVDCPIRPNTTDTQCTVIDQTFHAVGLARIPVTSKSLTGLSWTEGVAAVDAIGNRTYLTNFYLGTPPDTNLTGTGACAVFFGEVSKAASFHSDVKEAQGTCQEAIGAECVNALVERATLVDVKGLGNVEACTKLETAFKENLDPACKYIATGSNWTGLSVKALSGSGAPEPITPAQNSTSNCWPIVPKQYNLALVNSTGTPSDFYGRSAIKHLFSIRPILTLFYPGNGSLITETEAQMTCMKTIGLNSAENATKASSEKEEGAASVSGPSLATLIVALAFWTLAPF